MLTETSIAAKVINELLSCSSGHSETIGDVFAQNAISAEASTGVAATEIGGDTTSREIGLNESVNQR